MPDFKRILFLIVIILCFYVIYKLVQRRQAILKDHENDNKEQEPFEGKVEIRPRIKNSGNLRLPLKEYVIMSSWNSASNTEGIVSLSTLGNNLKRGYRFIDLEIYLVDNQAQVSFSSVKPYDVMESEPILFLDVCKLIVKDGFATNNGDDPLLLHLRIKSKSPLIFEELASILQIECNTRLYKSKVSGETILSDIKNRLVIVVDRNYVPDIDNYKCSGKCRKDFKKMINMYSGVPNFESMKFVQKLDQPTRPLQKTEDSRTNVEKMQMVTHGLGELNIEKNGPEFYTLVKNYKVQVFPHKVYYKDEYLSVYEDFFKKYHRAFVPMTIAFDFLEEELD
jgi:hypothetical protein